jgi:heavy metal translocating P-type ATPase
MHFTIRHALPGRVRLHVPALGMPQPEIEAVLGMIAALDWVRAVRVNYGCSSLVLEYDPAQEFLFQAMLAMLGRATLADLLEQARLSDTAVAPASSPPPITPPKARWPLLWPTITLGLALGGPVVQAINTPIMLVVAWPIFRRAWHVWSTEKRLNVDFLDTLAINAALLQDQQVAAGVITWLIRLGDWIRDLTAAGSKRAVDELLEYRAKSVWLVRDGTVVSIPAADLRPDDVIVVYPGEMIPADGDVIQGHGLIDQKTITGEGLPVNREVGEQVFAATILREGQIRVRAVRVGTDTTAGQIARLIDGAPIGDTRMQNHAERFADRLVLPTLTLAIGTALISRDFNRFLNLVIVDFGTGIRVAAPTAVLSSITHAARSGIIIKSGGHMEKLAFVDTVVFDKTGTLSHGTPHVVDMRSFLPEWPGERVLALATAAETHLQHPVAEALREKSAELGLAIPPCDETEYRIGLGVEGQVGDVYVHVGSERFMRQSGIAVDQVAQAREEIDRMGCSSLYVAVDGQIAGIVAYEDRIRPEARQVIARLHELGITETIMLTGDNATVARAVGERLGLTRQVANMMPADKARIIQELQAEGRRVVMIGDGINDSPALSFADVGIAMKHGADITHESADVVLMEDSLWKFVRAIEISRDAVGLIKQNYGIVAVMNGVALALALPSGLVTPEMTALISNGSAIIASLNGVRPLARRS